MVLTGRCLCYCVEESSSSESSASESSASESSSSESSASESSASESSASESGSGSSSESSSSESSASESSASESSASESGSGSASESSSSESSASESSASESSASESSASESSSGSSSESGSGSSSESGSSSSGSEGTCYLPSGTLENYSWTVYENGSLGTSGILLHEAVDEGVDTSDDAATAIRPPTEGIGKISFRMALTAEDIPAHWTQIDSVTARMRARVLQYGDEDPTDQVIECRIGDDGSGDNAGDATFTVSGTGWQTYEETPTPGEVLPALIEDLNLDDFATLWEILSETRKNEHSFEISAMEICLTGSEQYG